MKNQKFFAPKIIKNSVSLLCILSLFGCAENSQFNVSDSSSHRESMVRTTEDLQLKEIKKKWQTGNCKSEGDPCFTIEVSYPQFLDTNANSLAKINRIIKKEVSHSLQSYQFEQNRDSATQSLDQIVKDIFFTFNEEIEQNNLLPNSWVIELKGEQASETKNTLTILITEYSYLGGAHPNSYQTYLNFNRETGELIQLEEVISDPEAVLEIAEQQFRETYDLSSEETLTKAGLFENKLVFPENFVMTKEGLIFLYNPYEIGPYAAGYYEFQISWERLEGLVNKNYSSSSPRRAFLRRGNLARVAPQDWGLGG